MRTALCAALAAAMISAAGVTLAQQSASPEGAEVYFINISDGDVLTNPVTIQFGLRGMGVAPAGTDRDDTGHHHLIINERIEGAELAESIPADEQHVHFGGGQTEATLELPPGTHTMKLVLGDMDHVPHDPPVMSEMITVTVQ